MCVKKSDTLMVTLITLRICYYFDNLLAYEHKNKAILKVC